MYFMASMLRWSEPQQILKLLTTEPTPMGVCRICEAGSVQSHHKLYCAPRIGVTFLETFP